jgi:hypothetical protein
MRALYPVSLLLAVLGSSGAASAADLSCLSDGHNYRVGEYACLPACHGKFRYARCDAVASTASWTFVSDTCPSALLQPILPAHASLVPVVAAMTPRPLVINMSLRPGDAETDKAALSAAF